MDGPFDVAFATAASSTQMAAAMTDGPRGGGSLRRRATAPDPTEDFPAFTPLPHRWYANPATAQVTRLCPMRYLDLPDAIVSGPNLKESPVRILYK